ncbi:major tail protein [Paenibacillus sp. KR2-11]|uniref:major tail protein n=1 Tax=Paenibacillus sp. KR2-11 TaxID=3385500 RepID=UPI0038FC46F3
MSNLVTFGLEKVHIAFRDMENETQPSWEAPIALPGAVRWTPEAQGESSTFYADNTAYFIVSSNIGYTGELETALVPDALLARMLGWPIDSNGMLVETADANPAKFALLGQVLGDQRNRRFVYYDCQASRPAKERKTKAESIEVTTDVLKLSVSPIEIGEKKIVKGDIELSATNTAAYNAFFTQVYKPVFNTGGGGV